MQKYLSGKVNKLEKKKLKFQPHVVCLCEDIMQLGQRDSTICYAVIDSTVFYETSSLLEAVDICVKAAFVFGIQFPQAAHSSWLFVQRAVYVITTDFDNVSSKALELLTDVSN